MAFILDSSGSVGRENFELSKQFAADVTKAFVIGPNDTQVAAIVFSGFAKVSFELDTFNDSEGILSGINEINYIDLPGSSTYTADALVTLRRDVMTTAAGAREEVLAIPRVAVVVTDGMSNINRTETIPAAEAVHDAGIIVFAVGVGNRINTDELNAIASRPELVTLLPYFSIRQFQSLQRTLTIETCRSKYL